MKIKVIDIMNKIYNKENMPKQIKYDMKTYFYDETYQEYTDYDRTYGLFSDLLDKQYGIFKCLDDELEIIEEEKKIPAKLVPTSLKGIDNLDEKIEIAHIDTISVIETVNQLIDYLKSKGE